MDDAVTMDGGSTGLPASAADMSQQNFVAALNAAGITASNKAVNAPKYKKAPDAPKRFKSAFIIFSAEKHREIKENFAKEGRTEKTTNIAKLVSESWRSMESEEKEQWEEKARKDKARYEAEKAMYKGPWKVPANKRTPKDPTAPKRPMSAFLAFSNKRRAGLKKTNPEATNADLSKMLSKTWKEAPQELRQKYMDDEANLRAKYKVEMGKWRKKQAEEKKIEREEREAIAMQAAEARENEPAPPATANQYARAPGDMGFQGGGQQGQDMSAGQQMNMGGMPGQMYGNPYAMAAAAGQGGQPGGDMSGFASMQQQQQHYANLMAAGNPYAAQPFLGGNTAAAQQQLLSQLFGQQFQHAQQMQGGTLGMYSQQKGMQGQGGQDQGMQGMQQQQQQQPQQGGQGQGMVQAGFVNNAGFNGYGNMAMLQPAQVNQMGGGMMNGAMYGNGHVQGGYNNNGDGSGGGGSGNMVGATDGGQAPPAPQNDDKKDDGQQQQQQEQEQQQEAGSPV